MLSRNLIEAVVGYLRRTGVWTVIRGQAGLTFCCCLGGGVMAWVDDARPLPSGRYRTLTVADREFVATCSLRHDWGVEDTFVCDDWELDGLVVRGEVPPGAAESAQAILDHAETSSMAAGKAVLEAWAEATARRPAFLFGVKVGAEDACSPKFLLPLFLNAAEVSMSPRQNHETLFGVVADADAEGTVDVRALSAAVLQIIPRDGEFINCTHGFRRETANLSRSLSLRGLMQLDLVDIETKAAVYI